MKPEHMLGPRFSLGDCRDRFKRLNWSVPVSLRLRLGGVLLHSLLPGDIPLVILLCFWARLVLRRVGGRFIVRMGMRGAFAVSPAPKAKLPSASNSEYSGLSASVTSSSSEDDSELVGGSVSCVIRLLDVRDGFWRRAEAISVDGQDVLRVRAMLPKPLKTYAKEE